MRALPPQLSSPGPVFSSALLLLPLPLLRLLRAQPPPKTREQTAER